MIKSRKILGLVLAGGHSARMGKDKAVLMHPDGRTLVRRCADLLAEAGCELVVVSLRREQAIPGGAEGVDLVRDPENATGGPMTGMLAAMSLHPGDDWLVLACDLPRLDLATLSHLIDSVSDGENFLAYRSEFDGLPEPLCAYYASASREVLEAAVMEGFHCPRKILIRNDCRLLEPVTPRALENANTPEDWQTAIAP